MYVGLHLNMGLHYPASTMHWTEHTNTNASAIMHATSEATTPTTPTLNVRRFSLFQAICGPTQKK